MKNSGITSEKELKNNPKASQGFIKSFPLECGKFVMCGSKPWCWYMLKVELWESFRAFWKNDKS